MASRQNFNPRSSPLDETCGLLGVCKTTLNILLNRGELHRLKVGGAVRIHRDDIKRYLDTLLAGADA